MIAKPNNSSSVLDLADLPGRVHVVNADEVLAYLAQFPDLIPILPDLCAATRAEFGEEAALLLELVHDMEIYDPHLVLWVRLRHYDDTVVSRIFAVDAAFEERLTDAEGWLWVATDYRLL
jgi:hypothetical protein